MDKTSAPVAEIVTFEVHAGVSDADVAAAARGMMDLLAATPGFEARHLSKGETGWTDYILWTDMEAARAAAASVVKAPEAAPFMQMIDAPSVALRHEVRVLG
ncbi:hypothetical protein [Pseudaestuariivita sp.]|uniref:hypothetical protein n=1 Tax=Pseudaestuariivita sp. TaxID=2211669 RepID=UPI0040591469